MTHRIGLIGCGGIAGTWVKAVEGRADARITVTFDLDPAAARARAEETGATAVTDLDDLLGADVDVVIVCTPNPTHAELVQRAAAAGKHILCEKPMALTLEDCRVMMQAGDEAGVQLVIGHTIRFFGTFRTVRRLVAAGAIGTPVSGGFARTSVVDPQRAGAAGRWQGHWRQDPRTSGGMVLEGFVHELDCIRSVFGTVTDVTAQISGRREHGGYLSPQLVQALVRFESGALVSATTGGVVGAPTRGYWIGGTEGGLRFDRWGHPVRRFRPGNEVPEEVAAAEGNPYSLELDDLLRAVRGKAAAPENSGHNGLENVGLGLAIYHSAETGRRISFAGGVPDLPAGYCNTTYGF